MPDQRLLASLATPVPPGAAVVAVAFVGAGVEFVGAGVGVAVVGAGVGASVGEGVGTGVGATHGVVVLCDDVNEVPLVVPSEHMVSSESAASAQPNAAGLVKAASPVQSVLVKNKVSPEESALVLEILLPNISWA